MLHMRDEASVCAAFQAIGDLDHLVVAAGPTMGSWGSFIDEDIRGVGATSRASIYGSWACARHATPRFAPTGSITFLTGGSAVRSKAGLAAVTSSFAAVETLARSLAIELGPIRVNTIRPGFVDTEFWNVLSEADRVSIREKVRNFFPAHRLGVPADIGHAAVFLMTNPYTTGTVVEVAGGEGLVDWAF